MWRLKCILHHNLPLAIHGYIALNVPYVHRDVAAAKTKRLKQKNCYCLTRELGLDKRGVKKLNV